MNDVDTNAKIIWDYMLLHQELRPMDAVFALGSNDTRVAERAAELYLQGYGTYLICAGGHGKTSKLREPEAIIFSDIAKRMGVPTERIIVESKSTNTGENILFVRRLLKETGLNLHSFVLVQKPYMERRTFATFKQQWPDAECIVTSPQLSYEEYATDAVYKELFLSVMVGDLQRIKEYPAKGYQIPQEIPHEVWAAYERLVELGYTKYVMPTV